LDGGTDWTQELSLDRHRAAVSLLRKITCKEQERRKIADEVYRWLKGDLADQDGLPAEVSTANALARLAALDSQIEALLKERLRLGALVLDRLQQRLQRNEERFLQFDETLGRLRGQLEEVSQFPWLESPSPGDQYLALPADVTLHQAQKLVDAVRADVSRILQADSSLRDLRDRLAESPVLLVPRGVTVLAEIANCLEQSVVSHQRRFEELAAQEQRATDFLERLAAVVGRQSGERFIQETTAERWADLGHFLVSTCPCTEAGKRYLALTGRFDLAGLLVAHLWQLNSAAAVNVAAAALAERRRTPSRGQRRDLLICLNFGQLQELAVGRPEAAPDVADLIFATALRSTEPTVLAYLEPLLDLPELPQPCAGLYRACVDDWRAGVPVTVERLLEPAPRPTETPALQAEQHRLRLLRLIEKKPTMTHNYYRLRLLARTHFLEPLTEALRADDSERAWRQWQEAGDLNEMVEDCVRLVRLSGRRQELDRSHHQQTYRYLEAFDNELRQWLALQRPMERPRNELLSQAMAALRSDAEAQRHLASVRALETIRLLRNAPDHPDLPPLDFGQSLTSVGSDGPLLLNAQDSLNSLMTWSWPVALKHGAAPVGLVLADQLRQAVGAAPLTLSDAVQEYWQQGDFLAARDGATADPALHEKVVTRLEKKKADLLSARTELQMEADRYKEYEQDIVFWNQEIHRALDSFEFETIPDLFRELEAAVVQAKAQRDPVRLSLLEFLREAELVPNERAGREDMQRQVEDVKVRNQERRLHLLELEKVRDNTALPERLRERWSSLARNLDRPARWPSEEAAFDAAWAVQQFVTYLVGLWQDRESDPGQVDLFVQSFAEWVPQQCEADPTFASPAGMEALRQIKRLATDISTHRLERSILRTLGHAATAQPPATVPPAPVPAVMTTAVPSAPSAVPIAGRARDRQADADEVVRTVRSFLAGRMGGEVPTDGDPTQLRSAVRGYRWKAARELAAALARQAPAPEGSPPSDVEAVYAIALAYSVETNDRPEFLAVQQSACLAVLAAERSQYHYYLPPTLLKEHELAARAVVLAAGTAAPEQAYGSALGEQLGQVLTRLIDLAPTDPASEWLRELFWMASRLGDQVSARLAAQLWDTLRGKDNDESRACLLRLLFRLRRGEALRHLAGHAEPVDDLIKVCLNAFEQAEEDSSVRPQAREILITLREQAFGRRNTRPWINLFQHLESTRGEVGEPPLTCALQSDYLTREAEDGEAVVQVLLTPSLADPPRSLALHFLTDPASGTLNPPPVMVVTEEEMLLRAKAIEVLIPDPALVVSGEVIDVSYRLLGETILRKPIDLAGRWTFPNTYHNQTLLPAEAIARAWPGASGDPVVSGDCFAGDSLASRGFHGREEEEVRIERYLSAPGRGRSLMVFGQRRIGKTSLLLETVQNFPPRRGAVCGAFFDLNSLDTPSGAGEMQGAFFEFVMSKLATEPVNEPLRRALQQAAKGEVNLETLSRGLRPKVALEDALEGLVQRLEQVSGGLISRVAFFFDEFDLFVEPLLSGQREEVLKLHGSLRQIIQRSQRIMLVLAGSGLQRLFTEDYLHPFYGSIDELEVKPFDWATEWGRRAIEKTFLPSHFRPQLCQGDRFSEVAQRAADLTGGHPYYLSMLGFAAARAWRGHPLTPALLNRVADLLIQNKIDGGTFDINRRKFYQPVFQSLKRLSDHEQAVARLMLTSIARLTSTDRQRWKKWRLIEDQFIEDPEVRRLTTEDERLTALKYLEKERVVEFDKGRSEIRIRIPLTAAAIREDARDIHDEALRQLRGLVGRAVR